MISGAIALLFTCVAQLAGQTAQPAPSAPAAPPAQSAAPFRIFFLSDVHSRFPPLTRFIDAVERERPDLVIEGGDFTHDATESEFAAALALRAPVLTPWRNMVHLAHGRATNQRAASIGVAHRF